MRKVYVADKASYGAEFTREFDTLQELKEAIVKHQSVKYEYTNDGDCIPHYSEYNEENFKKYKKRGQYTLYEVELDDSEFIWFDEYDGSSSFEIRKLEVEILSTYKKI